MKTIDTLCFGENEEFLLIECSSENVNELYEAEKICFPGDPWSVSSFAEALETPPCHVFGVYNRQMTNIIAYGVIYIAADECDIANIAVLPQWRKKGVGQSLLKKMLEEGEKSGANRFFLEVRESNLAAQMLYEKAGFKVIGKRRKYYSNPLEDAVVMARI